MPFRSMPFRSMPIYSMPFCREAFLQWNPNVTWLHVKELYKFCLSGKHDMLMPI